MASLDLITMLNFVQCQLFDCELCGVPELNRIGDGYCDDSRMDGNYNAQDCNWDGGDCCEETCEDNKFECGTNGYNCKSSPEITNNASSNQILSIYSTFSQPSNSPTSINFRDTNFVPSQTPKPLSQFPSDGDDINKVNNNTSTNTNTNNLVSYIPTNIFVTFRADQKMNEETKNKFQTTTNEFLVGLLDFDDSHFNEVVQTNNNDSQNSKIILSNFMTTVQSQLCYEYESDERIFLISDQDITSFLVSSFITDEEVSAQLINDLSDGNSDNIRKVQGSNDIFLMVKMEIIGKLIIEGTTTVTNHAESVVTTTTSYSTLSFENAVFASMEENLHQYAQSLASISSFFFDVIDEPTAAPSIIIVREPSKDPIFKSEQMGNVFITGGAFFLTGCLLLCTIVLLRSRQKQKYNKQYMANARTRTTKTTTIEDIPVNINTYDHDDGLEFYDKRDIYARSQLTMDSILQDDQSIQSDKTSFSQGFHSHTYSPKSNSASNSRPMLQKSNAHMVSTLTVEDTIYEETSTDDVSNKERNEMNDRPSLQRNVFQAISALTIDDVNSIDVSMRNVTSDAEKEGVTDERGQWLQTHHSQAVSAMTVGGTVHEDITMSDISSDIRDNVIDDRPWLNRENSKAISALTIDNTIYGDKSTKDTTFHGRADTSDESRWLQRNHSQFISTATADNTTNEDKTMSDLTSDERDNVVDDRPWLNRGNSQTISALTLDHAIHEDRSNNESTSDEKRSNSDR